MTKKNVNKPSRNDSNLDNSIGLHKDLKANSYSSSLKRIRKQLPSKTQRSFSSYIHAHGMDSTHDLTATTLARPRSILTGSLLAFIGTLVGVYLSKYYGYNFNYLLFFLFYVVGYLIEFLIELIIGFLVRHK